MNGNQRGLYSKYQVMKDGKPLDGDCFVLRPDRDPAAVAALRAYAEATTNRTLASDIIGWIGEPEPLTLEQLREMVQPKPGKVYGPVWIKTLTDGTVSCQLCHGLIRRDCRYKPPKMWVDAHQVNLLLDQYGKTWLAYAHKPGKDGAK